MSTCCRGELSEHDELRTTLHEYEGHHIDFRAARQRGCLSFTGGNRLVYEKNSVRDKHVQFTPIYIESGTSLTIGAGPGTARKK